MAKGLILGFIVVSFLTITIVASADENWSYCRQYFSVVKNTTTNEGFFDMMYNGYDDINQVASSPGDDTQTTAYTITNSAGVPIRPDAFSYNTGVTAWLNSSHKVLLYSVAQLYDENGATTTKYGSNDDIRILSNGWGNPAWSTEALIKHVEPLVSDQYPVPPGASYGAPIADHTLGMQDIAPYYEVPAGRTLRGNELALADFQVRYVAPNPDERIYFSAGRFGSYEFGGTIKGNRPGVRWAGGTGDNKYAGTDHLGDANAGDILTCAGLGSNPSYGIFENAWKIAGTMVGDKFWTQSVNGHQLVWNNYSGYVSTSTASNAPEVAGHLFVRNFLRYIFDITAMKVEDVDGDGKFDAIDGDKVLFTLADDDNWTRISQYSGIPDSVPVDYFRNRYFPGGLGDAIYLYTGDAVITWMDRGTGLFFGANQSTGNATIWGDKYGEYDITGFDITYYVPEPVTESLIVAGLMLLVGVARRKIR
jgi:hypothetical protein